MTSQQVRAMARLRVTDRKITTPKKQAEGSYVYRIPQLRLSNAQLITAGFAPGDFVLVVCTRPHTLVIVRDPDQRATKDHKARVRRAMGSPRAPLPGPGRLGNRKGKRW